MAKPLVTVVVLNYNQARFLQQAVDSVREQTYPNVEIILVNDASTDSSEKVIKNILARHPDIRYIRNDQNLGNCRSFNKALRVAKGEYMIDLAADDMLLPDRVRLGVESLEKLGNSFAVHYGNAIHIGEDGQTIYEEKAAHPSGDLYLQLIERYFVNTASMMMRKSVLDDLGGYDEALSYEDFDFWIRSARKYKYEFEPRLLVAKRDVGGSLSQQQFRWRSKHLDSTFRVCSKIKELNKLPEENAALKRRIRYEIKTALRFGKFDLILRYLRLYFSLYRRLSSSSSMLR